MAGAGRRRLPETHNYSVLRKINLLQKDLMTLSDWMIRAIIINDDISKNKKTSMLKSQSLKNY